MYLENSFNCGLCIKTLKDTYRKHISEIMQKTITRARGLHNVNVVERHVSMEGAADGAVDLQPEVVRHATGRNADDAPVPVCALVTRFGEQGFVGACARVLEKTC